MLISSNVSQILHMSERGKKKKIKEKLKNRQIKLIVQ